MKLAQLYTRPLQDHEADGEIGTFELDVNIDDNIFLSDGDKKSLVLKTISMHLASAVMDTEVPTEYWRALIEDPISKAFDIPSHLSFHVRTK